RGRGVKEGPRKFVCDRRLRSRIRVPRAKQLPTNHQCAVSTREYQSDSSSLSLGRSDDWFSKTARARMASYAGRGLRLLSNDVKHLSLTPVFPYQNVYFSAS